MAGRKMIKNQGMLISVLVHILILSIPLSTTIKSLSGQGGGDMEISIIESHSIAPPAAPAEHPVPRGGEENIAEVETMKPVETGEKPEVKIPLQKKTETVAENEEAKDTSAAETVDIQTAGEEGGDKPAEGYAMAPEDRREETLQGKARAVEYSVRAPEQDAMPVRLSSGKPYVTAFGSADGPAFLKRVVPDYPRMARRLGREGRVLLRLVIDETGRLVHAEVVEKAGFGFDREAMEAVRKSVFLPARRNGVPVKSEALLPVRFVLRGG